ncbi:MAG: bifunctional UDP-N-acetylglucosamine diphosphorylase/glucosamine-1-phosphate N-acetyltransferase GlmU [Polyangiaceae bacterium]|jgi:bifunctional UDP-N-acetylglucosamine pyrophosphorylase/glucosamine-1-phosphate N-acetyltransferase
METTTAIILAAGHGTRMVSTLQKVMHPVCGVPMVGYAVRAALEAGCADVVVVVGHGRGQVEEYLAEAFPGAAVRAAVQAVQRGTGDAASVGLEAVRETSGSVLILNGDVPLVTAVELRLVVSELSNAELSLATCVVEDPTGYGRILRKAGRVTEIREHRDLRGDGDQCVCEVNGGIYAVKFALLRQALAALVPQNAQGELYLTDIVGHATTVGARVEAVTLGADALAGVNDREQLNAVEQGMYERVARRWRLAGVTIRPGVRIDANVHLEPDVTLESGVVLRGHTRVARGATADVGCVLTDVDVREGAVVKPYCVATRSSIGPGAQVGPFSHLRKDSQIGENAHVGNFVETKKTRLGPGAKANHLAYLGDSVIGERTNIGAGTILCNYDGFQKHTTCIGPDVFVGSDSQVVAPVTIGAGAYIATGTTVTHDVPAGALAIGRVPQQNKDGYAEKLRARLKSAKDAGKT